ncbi:di/tricarboxylate transporter [Rhodopseudomonas julia]|uniref:Di/tricarboxylate transporter n=1 Tax=Rhodopseudomonas julia TaxID=200617 RepID=A0ABU0C9N5_9BRAD|nr:SLC13 family permease [Rhodopseudomonas julia]MDQ0327240.1 di/tricarboxylate transporter [Rhodopseudomonas julia]
MTFSDLQMWLTFGVIALTIVGFSLERLAVETTALASLVLLTLVFVVAPGAFDLSSPLSFEDLLQGFANPALVAVLSLIVVGQGLFQTGALDAPSRHLARNTRLPPSAVFVLLIVFAGALSAFLNNTPVVVMMIPVLMSLAREQRISPAKLLMAMNFATIIGGSTTLIGSSTNLLVAQVAHHEAGINLRLFDLAAPGLAIAAVAVPYILFVIPRLFGKRPQEAVKFASGKQFITEIVLPEGHPLVGMRSVAGLFPGLRDITVRLVRRGGTIHLPPFEDIELQPGDLAVFSGIREDLARHGIIKPARGERSTETAGGGTHSVGEAIVAPGGRIIGRSPAETGIEQTSGISVVAVERRGRMSRQAFSDVRLEEGDVLLLSGTDAAFDRLRGSRDLLLLEKSFAPLPARRDTLRSILIFTGLIVLAATGLVPIAIAALGAALLMLAFGCLNIRQARRAFDSRIFMLIGASIALATALERTGGAQFLAEHLVAVTEHGGPRLLLSALFALIAILTNVLSNNATAVLFTPIAVSAAAAIGAPPLPFIMAVIFAANASFATPIGYQTNLLVMGPGNYRFVDFLLAGGPLTIISWLVFSLFAPWYYGI